MSEAELRIRPTVVGSVEGELNSVRRNAERLGRTQERDLARGQRVVDRLSRTYDRLSTAVGRVRSGVRSAVDNIFSMRTAVMGVATGMAGRTVFDKLIGSNVELEQQRITFQAMLGDVEQAEGLIGSIRDFAASTPFEQGDLIQGSRTLLRVTEDNVAENERLLETAAEMSALTGGQRSVQDASEALARASAGEFRGLRAFGLRLTKADVDEMRRDGEELGDAAVRAAVEEFESMTAGEDLVETLSQSVGGRISTLRDKFSELMREAGEPAFAAFGEGVDELTSRVEDLRADPEFMEQMERFGEWTGDIARSVADWAPTLVDKVPRAAKTVGDLFRRAREFYDRHPGLVKFLAGTVAANHLTGGMVGDMAGGLIRGGVGALIGRRGGGGGMMATGAGAMSAGHCCCAPGMGGTGSGMKGGLSAAGRAAAGGLTASQLGSVGVGAGGGTVLAKGGMMVAGGALAPAALAGAFGKAWSDTLNSGTEAGEGSRVVDTLSRQELTGRLHRRFETVDSREDFQDVLTEVHDALGGSDAVFTGEGKQGEMFRIVENSLARFGLDADIEEGQRIGEMEFTKAGFFRRLQQDTNLDELTGMDLDLSQFAGQLNFQRDRLEREGRLYDIDVNIDMQGTASEADVERAAQRGVDEAVREHQLSR